jgi:predicted esterase
MTAMWHAASRDERAGRVDARPHRRRDLRLSACMSRSFALLLACLVASSALGAPGLKPGLNEFKVELPRELRQLAARGRLSPVAHALVTVAVPENFDAARDWPVVVITATSDPQYNSSRRLLRDYAESALAGGWLLVAVDPEEQVSVEQDDVAMRYALTIAALAALRFQWPRGAKAPLAFGGFSGGAKYSAWLAAAFTADGRNVVGMYLAGINLELVVAAAQHFRVMSDSYRSTPVFLQSGDKDEIATPDEHRTIYTELKRAGFSNVRLEHFPGSHELDPGSLRTALDWFSQLAAKPGASK